MKIINVNDSFQLNSGIAATVGFFDGVHTGHRYLINQLKFFADIKNLPTAVITFSKHPRVTLRSDYIPELLNTLDEKLYQLSTTGIDYCFVSDFTEKTAQLSASTFIKENLNTQLNVKQLLIGYDHRFGKNREENFDDYVKYGEECGLDVVRAMELSNIHVSSTMIRKHLQNGNLSEANRLLSYNYRLEGKVTIGDQLGRQIGFPTANLDVNDTGKVIPAKGVYAARVYLNHEKYCGMVYIGKRPTITSKGEERIEVHILDFSGDLYGKILQLEFIELIRQEKHFSNLDELKKQLTTDKHNIISALYRE